MKGGTIILEKFNRIRMGLRAFWVIATGKHHGHSDDKKVSILGNYHDINRYIASIGDLYNTETMQEYTLREAKEILNNEK